MVLRDVLLIHGQATVFVATIVIPFTKVSKVAKLKALSKLRKLKGSVSGQLDKLKKVIDTEDAGKIKKLLDDGGKGTAEFIDYIKVLKTKTNPRRDLPDGIFEKRVTGDDIQYEAVGGGEKIWTDGVDASQKALVDAKHNPGDFYTLDNYNQKPFLYGDLEEEFRRYSRIVADKSNPADKLIIYISKENRNSVLLFEHLGTKHNVPTKIELIPWTP